MARKYEIKILTRFLLTMASIVILSYIVASLYIGNQGAIVPETKKSPMGTEAEIIKKQQERIKELETKLQKDKPESDKIFERIEKMPLFSGCEDENDETKRKHCATDKMLKFIYKISNIQKLPERIIYLEQLSSILL